jgi:hypothetical protein
MSIEEAKRQIVRSLMADVRATMVSMSAVILLYDKGKFDEKETIDRIRQCIRDLDDPLGNLRHEGF